MVSNAAFTPDVFMKMKLNYLTDDGRPVEIPVGGSIGLLAAGDLGIIAWRQKILEVKIEMAKRTQINMGQ